MTREKKKVCIMTGSGLRINEKDRSKTRKAHLQIMKSIYNN